MRICDRCQAIGKEAMIIAFSENRFDEAEVFELCDDCAKELLQAHRGFLKSEKIKRKMNVLRET